MVQSYWISLEVPNYATRGKKKSWFCFLLQNKGKYGPSITHPYLIFVSFGWFWLILWEKNIVLWLKSLANKFKQIGLCKSNPQDIWITFGVVCRAVDASFVLCIKGSFGSGALFSWSSFFTKITLTLSQSVKKLGGNRAI